MSDSMFKTRFTTMIQVFTTPVQTANTLGGLTMRWLPSGMEFRMESNMP